MRKTKLLLAAVAAMFVGQVSAQSWTGNEPAEGTFLLYNVGADKYINNGDPKQDWGTNSYLQANFGLDFKLEMVSENVYKLNSDVTNGGDSHYLATTLWCDGAGDPWTFEAVDGQENTYTIQNGSSYLIANEALDDIMLGDLTEDNKSWWKLVSLDDFKAAMNEKVYSESDPMDVSVFIKARSFARNDNRNSAWVTSHDGGNWSWIEGAENKYYGNEAYNNTFDVHQVISGLPSGTYEVQCSGFDTKGTTFVYGNKASAALQTDNETEFGTNKQAKWKAIHENNAFAGQSTGTFNVADGIITLGVKREEKAGSDWCVYDEFRLFYYGPLADMSAFEETLNDAIADAEAINQEAKMRASVLKALQDAINDYKGKTYSTEEEYNIAIGAVKKAIDDAKASIKSYEIIAAGSIPDNSLNGWTCTNSNTFHINTWSSEGNSDGSNMKTPFIENWVGKGSLLGEGVVSYTLEGLEPGESYYASALVRSYNEKNEDAPNGPNFFINDQEVSLPDAGTTFTYSGMSGIYATLGGEATVGEDGKLTLGVKIAEDRNYNWVAFKNVSIQSMSDAIAKAIANAKALEGKIPAGKYEALDAFVASRGEATLSNIEAINAEVEVYKEFVAPYADFLTMRTIAEELAAAGTDDPEGQATLSGIITTQGDNAENAVILADITLATSTLKEAMTTYATTANPVGEGEKFNMTFMLTNPDLTDLPTWQKADGWYTDQEGGNSQVMTNANATSEDGTKTFFFEYYNNPPQTDVFALYQKLDLPAGTYFMSCYAFAQNDGDHLNHANGVYFYANDTEGSAINNARLSLAQIDFVNDADQEVKIGLKPVDGNGNNWMGIGYVQLYKVPAVTIDLDEAVAYTPESKAGKVTLKKTIYKDWNTVALPFGVNAETVTAQFGEGNLYKFIDADGGMLIFETATAIDPHTPYLFKSVAGDGTLKTLEFEGVTISEGTPVAAGADFNFVGTYAPLAAGNEVITNKDYMLVAGNKFQKAQGGNALKAFRAYIKQNEEVESRQFLTIVIDGETTAIDTIDGKAVNSNAAIYNLAGQKVKNAQKGIFIQNGKKMVK